MRVLYTFLTFVSLLFSSFYVHANRIRIDSVEYVATSVGVGETRLTMRFSVVWENSWRDDYNYDAAYVFFKFRRKEEPNAVRAEEWNHLFLTQEGNKILEDFQDDYDFWLSPLSSAGTDFNTGVYIYRKNNGVYATDSVRMQVTWNVTNQIVSKQLTTDDIRNGDVQIVGHAIEMVYIPRGAFRIGDGVANKGFRKKAFPILAQYDIVSSSYKLESSNGLTDSTAVYAADRVNDNTGNALSEWTGTGDGPWWWSIDFGAGNAKHIRYFGVNCAKNSQNYPTRFALLASNNPDVPEARWDTVWSGAGKEYWMNSMDAYPAEKAIPVTNAGRYRAYKLYIFAMNTGVPVISTIGMTEKDLTSLIDYSVLIDSPETEIDSMRKLGAADSTNWATGKLPATFPNGYSGFYAMKYEISQDQYVRFLNKLTFRQQNNLLDNRLGDLQEGNFVYGDKDIPNARNGIILAIKLANDWPAVFACDLNANGVPNEEEDGENVACNYLSMRDMLAYADWACLRPLSEMEYEKMCRPFYPELPVRGGYAWGTTLLEQPANIDYSGTDNEQAVNGNANWGSPKRGPLRVGAFARSDNPKLENSGAAFWGCMDLSGNLAEMYYNVNKRGLTLVAERGDGNVVTGHDTSHGDGKLDDDGQYNGAKAKYWSEDHEAIAVRGGSFASPKTELETSDRTWFTNYFKGPTERDSSVSFRLGRTGPVFPQLVSWLISEQDSSTEGTRDLSEFFLEGASYIIRGNKPENPQGGLISYIWYSSESNGEMKVMEGQTNRDLYFDKFRYDSISNSVSSLNFKFRRKVFTPFTDSELSSQYGVNLITEPFASTIERFDYVNDTHQVTCVWDATIPHEWGFDRVYEGLQIDPKTGIISGLNSTYCNVIVTLKCTLYPSVIYKKRVRENTRRINATGNVQSIRLYPGTYTVQCYGAKGGSYGGYSGGAGGYAGGSMTVTGNTLYYLYVGKTTANATGGWNGGGNAPSYRGGGGATDIRTVNGVWNSNLEKRILIAGGGGGASHTGHGGAGGGSTGGNGTSASGTYGKGGSQSAAGYGGNLGIGGTALGHGGGGGGGYYGGGGGINACASAGGGGSGYINTTYIKKGGMSNGANNSGDGYILITLQ